MSKWGSVEDELFEIDDELLEMAVAASRLAYVPYSNYPVGAAGRTSMGDVVIGCNIENASFGLTMCAEVTLLGNAITRGSERVIRLVVVDRSGELLAPCGRCRQMLVELADPACLVARRDAWVSLQQLLPDAWTTDNLNS